MRPVAILVAALLAGGCASFGEQPRPTVAEVALPPAFAFAPDAAESPALSALLPVTDPAFQALSRKALDAAPDLAAALARVDAARALAARAGAERLPQVDGSATIEARRQNVGQFGPAAEFVDSTQVTLGAGLSARWEADLFGQLRARERAATERLSSAGAEAAAVRLALIAEVAAAVSDWRALAAREAALADDRRSAEDLARLAGVRERAGLSPGADRLRAEALAAASRGRMLSLEASRADVAGRLVALTGEGLAAIRAQLSVPAPPVVGGGVPAALPSTLLSRRPDVLGAGARLRAANSDLAAAAAARFPRLNLSAGLGLLAFGLGGLFDTDAIVGNLGAGLAAPLLDFGRLRADEARARAGTAEALAFYRGTVFRALAEAESGYALVEALTREVEAARAEEALRSRSARLVETRYRAGLTNFLDVLEARRAASGSAEAVAAAEGRLARARVLLWRALGGSAPPPD